MTEARSLYVPGRTSLDTDILLGSLKAAPDLPVLPIYQDALYALIPGASAPDGMTRTASLAKVPDALGRLSWTAGNNAVVHYAMQDDSAGSASFQVPTLTSAEDGINGRRAMLCSNIRCGVYHIDPNSSGAQLAPNLAQLAKQLTSTYCEIVVFAGPTGQTGRVFGQAAGRDGNEADIADAGSGFGFLANANGGKMLYQSRADAGQATSANRLVFNRALADWAPVLALVRGRQVNGLHVGEVWVMSSGSLTIHPFSFAQPPISAGALPWTFTGILSGTIVSTNQRKVSYRSRLNHFPADGEMQKIVSWFANPANYGPF